MNIRGELSTITSTLAECSTRLTSLVDETHDTSSGDLYSELVAAERTIGALLRRLQRAASKLT